MVEKKSINFALAFFFAFCILPVISLADTFETNDTISQGFITGDAGIRDDINGTCFSGSPIYIDSDSDSGNKRGFIAFDFSSLTYDSINNATLELSLSQMLNYNVALSYEMYYCDDTFYDGGVAGCEVTWNNQTEKVTNCSATPFYTTTLWNAFGQNTTFNMTEIILNESAGDKIFAIKIKMNPESYDTALRRVSWYSKDWSAEEKFPRLKINYEYTVVTTSTTTTIIPPPEENQTHQICVNDYTLKVSTVRELCDNSGCEELTLSEFIYCPNGCAENQCKSTPLMQLIFVIVFIVIIAFVIWWFLS